MSEQHQHHHHRGIIRALMVLAALDAVLLGGTALALGDVEAAGLAVLALAAIGLLRIKGGIGGAVFLVAFFGNIAYWTLSGTLDNLLAQEELADLLLPGVHALVGLVGFVAPIPLIIWKLNPGGYRAPMAAGVATLLLAGVMGLSYVSVRRGESEAAQPGDILVRAENTDFSERTIVSRAGRVAVHFANDDFFWHTFTIDPLGVDLKVPVGGERRSEFTAEPGTYRYYCRIPGHELIMDGTLEVR